ncbi:hypothetical protein [Pseudomonas sp. GL-RE-19]|uniref:hypothetical protein n=1 Tax=Pseudomonas sp. GL-RE-19 TaxID=2832389 RepID=UPI001CBD4DCA|nr:hypothetical protein [Pseudomonas sp. GL-RE-19]
MVGEKLPDGWRGEYRSTGGDLHGFALMGEAAITDSLLLAKQIKERPPAMPPLQQPSLANVYRLEVKQREWVMTCFFAERHTSIG